MEEQKIFKEDNVAFTTHRFVWGDSVIECNDMEKLLFMPSDIWRMSLGMGVVGLILLSIGAAWSVIGGILLIGIAGYSYYKRDDVCIVMLRDGTEERFTVTGNKAFFDRIRTAWKKRVDIVDKWNKEKNQNLASTQLADIDSLPDA